jgi:uncharacterized protein
MPDTSTKLTRLHEILASYESVIVAYSGGVDSSFLAAAAHDVLGPRSLAVTAVSASMARREVSAARDLASKSGWSHLVVPAHEVDREEYRRNDSERCYWCKTELFEVLDPLAEERGATILVGTNLDDLGDHRPGQEAARQRGVETPLVDAGLSKSEVRRLSADIGLPTADKPASPCLASRFAYGIRVTPEGLRRIDKAEEMMRSLGFTIFRVRDHGDLARVEVQAEEIPTAAAHAATISEQLKTLGFTYVSLDLAGFRSGSLNEVLGLPRIKHSNDQEV